MLMFIMHINQVKSHSKIIVQSHSIHDVIQLLSKQVKLISEAHIRNTKAWVGEGMNEEGIWSERGCM